jgi:hypothetical protein
MARLFMAFDLQLLINGHAVEGVIVEEIATKEKPDVAQEDEDANLQDECINYYFFLS